MPSKKMHKKKNSCKVKQGPPTQVGPIFNEEDRLAEEQRLAACICARDKTTVRCTLCGALDFGRVYRECTAHKNVVFLYDLRNCSKCLGSFRNLEELPIDFGTYQKLTLLPKA